MNRLLDYEQPLNALLYLLGMKIGNHISLHVNGVISPEADQNSLCRQT